MDCVEADLNEVDGLWRSEERRGDRTGSSDCAAGPPAACRDGVSPFAPWLAAPLSAAALRQSVARGNERRGAWARRGEPPGGRAGPDCRARAVPRPAPLPPRRFRAPEEPDGGVRHEERGEEPVRGEHGVEGALEADARGGGLPLEEGDELVLEARGGVVLGAEELGDEEGEGLVVGGDVEGGAEEAGVGALGGGLPWGGLGASARWGEKRRGRRNGGRGVGARTSWA